ncbi:hypothetical protein QMO56_00520 [Roseomonas sp. E05]|uniref:hypothetical protein n=1 Tax=Roseomonas sp. E05 TaxID=3046310 RepID=UPI0024BA08CB|nr:hypothetical protein [Roseomonas sp. E05]MDJ0386580.1 hypothetical protein [Roseomonas sp. E05]
MRKTIMRLGLAGGVMLGLAACSDPYSPGQRAVGGGLLGAGVGAGVGSLSGNAGTGALLGGAVGAAGGALTTPERPRDPYYGAPYGAPPPGAYRGYGY